ncbi:MAG: transketolase [Gemmatimonadaceae bacterium]|nr:transketolase [Gemmatimonadaceae bacterium]
MTDNLSQCDHGGTTRGGSVTGLDAIPFPRSSRRHPLRIRQESPVSAPADASTLDALCINTIRTLSMDAVQKAESGHPGAPMGLAPLAYALYTKYMRHNPADPAWPNRDRFVLSNGHASMLLYSALHLSGYDLSLDEIRNFRQWGSKTPGHPEYGHTPGVESTTGPLGQGLAMAVGMAAAEAHLAATFNRDAHAIVDHFTYFIAGDGCLMEGISHEAASFAGHFQLGKLIGFYDDNGISIDGKVGITYSDDAAKRFEAYGWQVLRIDDVNDLAQIDAAIVAAKADRTRPTLVITKTHIGYGSPNRQDTAKAHGEPLGAAEIALTKERLGWPESEPFTIPAESLAHWRLAVPRGAEANDAWRKQVIAYAKAHPELAKEFGRRMQGELPAAWQQALPVFTPENGNIASRNASGVVLNALGAKIPELIGGSADLSGSNITVLKDSPRFGPDDYAGRNIHFGVREFGMGAIMNGLALHGGVIPYGGTFLVFADYMRASIRLAALMGLRVIYVFTHDSIGLGEDGPTHQPVEHLSSLRCIPNVTVIRPADAAETAEAWRAALLNRKGPTALILTRQKLPLIDRAAFSAASGVAQGAYVLADAADGAPDVVLVASGSEVELALQARQALAADGVQARVVSMPSQELFQRQPAEYQASVLPPGTKRVAVEAAHSMSWQRYVGLDGGFVGIDTFGASAPYQTLYAEFGITAAHVISEARRVLGR